MNQKQGGISVIEKQTAQPGNVRENYSRQTTQIHEPKKKFFLYSNEGTIDYNQQCHPLHLGNKQYKQFPKKNKQTNKQTSKDMGRSSDVRRGSRRRRGGVGLSRGVWLSRIVCGKGPFRLLVTGDIKMKVQARIGTSNLLL